ncbi:hypothetical protein F5Y00DRAFT_244374, partial [Daldinia vernicosa]|uniref:uncharacterized protein n=1 Tax=Daldinia vernicosa TaxID=114800 RepID=UPI002007A22F
MTAKTAPTQQRCPSFFLIFFLRFLFNVKSSVLCTYIGSYALRTPLLKKPAQFRQIDEGYSLSTANNSYIPLTYIQILAIAMVGICLLAY